MIKHITIAGLLLFPFAAPAIAIPPGQYQFKLIVPFPFTPDDFEILTNGRFRTPVFMGDPPVQVGDGPVTSDPWGPPVNANVDTGDGVFYNRWQGTALEPGQTFSIPRIIDVKDNGDKFVRGVKILEMNWSIGDESRPDIPLIAEVRFQLRGQDPGQSEIIDFRELLRTNSVAFIPEPSSWAFFIAGFGLVGAAMRRRRLIQN
jgi:hypothetical protein